LANRGRGIGLLTLPCLIWLLTFLVGPLLFIAVTSLQAKGVWGGVRYVWNLENFTRAFDRIYWSVIWSSIRLALTTSLSCLVIAYPMAWYMTRLGRGTQKLALLLVMLPFMSNFVVRAYAVKFLIGVEGPLNRMLMLAGAIQTPLFLDDPGLAVWFGMVTNYLPFMVLPLYVALERFDVSLLEAARDLGASSWQVWRKVFWPLTRASAFSGLTLVFIPALGEFVIPDLMGGAKTMYLGNLLADQFLKSRDWPFGAAICVVMMLTVLVIARLMRFSREPIAAKTAVSV